MKKVNLKLILLLMVMSITAMAIAHKEDGGDEKKLPYTLQYAEDGHVFFDKVYSVDGVSKEDLYKRSKQWATATLKTVDNNIAFDDKEFNYINTTGTLYIPTFGGSIITMKVSLHFKDNKVKFECPSFDFRLTDPKSDIYSEFGKLKMIGKKIAYRSFDEKFTALLQSFENAIKKPSQDNSNW